AQIVMRGRNGDLVPRSLGGCTSQFILLQRLSDSAAAPVGPAERSIRPKHRLWLVQLDGNWEHFLGETHDLGKTPPQKPNHGRVEQQSKPLDLHLGTTLGVSELSQPV